MQQHSVPNQGFAISKFIQDQLNIQLNSIANDPIFDKCKCEIEMANQKVDEIKQLKEDSEPYIYDYFQKIKRNVELRRETLKRDIDEYSNKLIKHLDEMRSKYYQLSMKSVTKPDILKTKIELNWLINKLDTFKIDDKKFHDIKESVVVIKQKLDSDLIELQSGLIGHREYYFDYIQRPISEVFGKLYADVTIHIFYCYLDTTSFCHLGKGGLNQKYFNNYQNTKRKYIRWL